jgi:uncharacterized protein with beta-barrel porin domain
MLSANGYSKYSRFQETGAGDRRLLVVNGAAQASDAALVTGSAEMKWLNSVSLAATFEGEFSDVSRSYAGKGVARYAW